MRKILKFCEENRFGKELPKSHLIALKLSNNPQNHPHPSPPPSRERKFLINFKMFALSPRGHNR
jgi:hypothetical protein